MTRTPPPAAGESPATTASTLRAAGTPVADDPRLGFGFALAGLGRRWRRLLDDRLDLPGLTLAAWPPLVHLARSGDGVPQSELAARVGIDGSSLVRLIDQLSEHGLVERRADPQDRRARLIFLTAEGRQQTLAIEAQLEAIETAILGDLDDETILRARAAFARLEERIADLRDSGAAR